MRPNQTAWTTAAVHEHEPGDDGECVVCAEREANTGLAFRVVREEVDHHEDGRVERRILEVELVSVAIDGREFVRRAGDSWVPA